MPLSFIRMSLSSINISLSFIYISSPTICISLSFIYHYNLKALTHHNSPAYVVKLFHEKRHAHRQLFIDRILSILLHKIIRVNLHYNLKITRGIDSWIIVFDEEKTVNDAILSLWILWLFSAHSCKYCGLGQGFFPNLH